MQTSDPWLSGDAVLRTLGIRKQTLYAYVSRKLVRARPDPADPRLRQYSGYDVSALLKRQRGSRRRVDIASGAIAWGEPVLESAISTVRDGKLIFRGRDAVDFSARATLEDAAALLWQCEPPAAFSISDRESMPRLPTARERAFVYLARCAAQAPPSFQRSPALLQADAWALLSEFANVMIGSHRRGPIHARIAATWRLDHKGAEIIRRALVLLSDHELNASTFTVRVTASTGASLAAAALAGFCALSGPLHGQASARSLDLLDRMLASGNAKAYIAAAIQRGEPMLGFGHQLYPLGDIRGTSLLRVAKPRPAITRALRIAEKEIGLAANVDMVLAALTRNLGLIDDAPFIVFAIGRMAGWLAHAMEQRAAGHLIRPRARYIGL